MKYILPENKNYIARYLELNDYNKDYCNLLEQLTTINNITYDMFNKQFINIDTNENHYIIVIEDLQKKKIIGSGTLLIENKFIHDCKNVGHIEDIVIDKHYRNNKLGGKLIKILVNIATKNNCYKVILNCSNNLITYYKKIGFGKEINSMVYRF